MQKEVVSSERGVEISDNLAKSAVKKAEGEASATKVKASADAANTKIRAAADADATKLRAGADAEQITKTGNAQAEITLAQGKSQAEAYKLSVEAMGGDNYPRLKMIEEISKGNMKLMPENIIIGGGQNGSSSVENFLAISMVEKLTGKPFNELPKTIQVKEDDKKS